MCEEAAVAEDGNRGHWRLERLGALGHDHIALARIHGPAGLSIGAVSPAEIAVSVMAEMTGALRQSTAKRDAA